MNLTQAKELGILLTMKSYNTRLLYLTDLQESSDRPFKKLSKLSAGILRPKKVDMFIYIEANFHENPVFLLIYVFLHYIVFSLSVGVAMKCSSTCFLF